MSKKWLTANEAVMRLDPYMEADKARRAIAHRAAAGLVRSKATTLRRHLVGGHYVEDDHFELPPGHWNMPQTKHATSNDWIVGDFSGFDAEITWQSYGTMFSADDVNKLRDDAKIRRQIASNSNNPGGRPMSEGWAHYVAELVLYFHEEGIPEGLGTAGIEKVIDEMDARLEAQGKPTLSRSTVQKVVAKALERLREFSSSP